MLHDVLASMSVYNFLRNNLIVAMNKYKIQLKTMQIYKFAWQPFLTASSYIGPKYVTSLQHTNNFVSSITSKIHVELNLYFMPNIRKGNFLLRVFLCVSHLTAPHSSLHLTININIFKVNNVWLLKKREHLLCDGESICLGVSTSSPDNIGCVWLHGLA